MKKVEEVIPVPTERISWLPEQPFGKQSFYPINRTCSIGTKEDGTYQEFEMPTQYYGWMLGAYNAGRASVKKPLNELLTQLLELGDIPINYE